MYLLAYQVFGEDRSIVYLEECINTDINMARDTAFQIFDGILKLVLNFRGYRLIKHVNAISTEISSLCTDSFFLLF